MENEDTIAKFSAITNIDPTEFDVTVSALLFGIGAEKYADIFKQNNIGQCTLSELSNEDLIKLGLDDSDIRQKLLDEVKNLPLYEDAASQLLKHSDSNNLNSIEIVDIIEDSSQHLNRIYLSVLANTLAIKKNKKILDCLVHEDKYASDVALATLSEITNILNSMESSIKNQLKSVIQESPSRRNKKLVVGAVGSVVIAVLTVMFVKSLKGLKVNP